MKGEQAAFNRRLSESCEATHLPPLGDDPHHWLKFSNVLKVGNATAGFFRRKLMRQQQMGKR
ncbi:hypothetical protein GCM10023188_30330 [Pontibacter saemangeumensis]|uniref:Transposase n=1 Tax=Pontibacter saemangeumensis TaxID=1084525 RepID=A0ABP8LVW5_9BACT